MNLNLTDKDVVVKITQVEIYPPYDRFNSTVDFSGIKKGLKWSLKQLKEKLEELCEEFNFYTTTMMDRDMDYFIVGIHDEHSYDVAEMHFEFYIDWNDFSENIYDYLDN